DPFVEDPLPANLAGQPEGANSFGDLPAFDDASGFGHLPAFEEGLGFDNLPAFDAEPLAAPADIGPDLSAGPVMTDVAPAFSSLTPAASANPVTPNSVEQQPAAGNDVASVRVHWGALAAGVALGFVLLAGEGFLLFRGDSSSVVAETGDVASIAEPDSQSRAVEPALESDREKIQPEPQATRQDHQETPEGEMLQADSVPEQQDQPGEQRSPPQQPLLAEVVPDQSHYTLGGSGGNRSLPTSVRSVAYDEQTGRIAITVDSKDGKSGAVAVYEIDKVLNGPGEPIATFETPGLPTSVAVKPWKEKRLFAVACNSSADVWLYDVDTLEPAGKVSAGASEVIDIQDLGSSRDQDDPFLYFAALQSYERHGSTSKGNVIGRLDLSTMSLDSKTLPPQPGQKTAQPDGRVAVSADGSTLFGKEASFRYEKLPGDGKLGMLMQRHEVESRYGSVPTPGPFGVQTLAANWLCSRDLFVTDNTGVLLLACGKQNAILLGVEKLNSKQPNDPIGRIKILSANNYKVHASANLDSSIFFNRTWGFLDEQRKLAILATGRTIMVWRDLLENVPEEPWLTVMADVPEKVTVDKEISIPLQTPAGGDVTYEFIDESPYFEDVVKETVSPYQVSYRSSLTFGPFAGYTIPDNITLRGDFDILVMLQTPEGKWTRQYTTKEVIYRDWNNDGTVDRTDDVGNPDRKLVDIETVTASDMTITFKPFSDGIRNTLRARTNGAGQVYQYARERPVRAAVCVVQQDSPTEITPITKVATLNVLVTDSVAVMRGTRGLSGVVVPKPEQPLQNRLPRNDFRKNTKFASAQDSPIVINGNTLTWTPTAKQIGKLSLGIRARSGDLVKDTYFGVNVQLGGANDGEELPFYVNGISFQRDSDLAVIWGNDSDVNVVWEYGKKKSSPQPGMKYMVGVYDWRQGKVLRHQEVPLEIDFAAISPSGICATVSNPPRLVRFDYQTLKPIKQVPLKTQALRIVVVADKYVATTAYDNGERFELPSLNAIQPDLPATSTWLAEDFGDGWMWEGVHWDKPMREAKLLAMPIAFGVGPDRNSRGHIAGFAEAARMEPSGPVLLTLHESQAALQGLPMPMHPCRMSVYRHGTAVIGELHFEYDKEIRKVIIPPAQENSYARKGDSLFVAHGPEHSAAIVDGKVRLIPYSLWELPDVGFNFKPVQSTFLLDASRPTKVQYSAPDAVKYRLRVMNGYTNRQGSSATSDSNAKVLFEGESADGSFKIAFDSVEPLVEAARKIAGNDGFSYRNRSLTPDQLNKENADTLVAYRNQVTDTFRSLTGRGPRKIPVPIYAYVTAENAAGEKAALFHAYLVDVDASNPAKR
ncbi:MAG: hypothetical protein KDB00_15560, partial [Planctomycetales bacterium]|nr:hypothetical protein [Planctomycetales bacterium]